MDPVTSADVYRHRNLQDLTGSPRHGRAAFVVSRASRARGGYRSTAWLVDTAAAPGTRARPLTSPDHGARSLVIDPDGKRLAFLSERDPERGTQVHVLPLDGGEARAITTAKEEFSSLLAWAQDGSRLLALQSVPWKEDEDDDPDASSRPLVVRHLPWKMDGAGPKVGRRTRLVEVDAKSGEVRPLVEGDFDVSDAAWLPDGQRLAYSRKREGRQRHQADLWLARADGSEARQASDDLYSVTGLRFSPDGRRLAFAAGRIEGDSIVGLYLYDVQTGERHAPGGDDLQLEGASVVWNADGTQVATIASRRGLFEIVVVDAASGAIRPIERGLRHVTALVGSGDGLLFVASSLRRLDEVFHVGFDGAGERRLTAFNRRWFRQRQRPRVSKRAFEVPKEDGGTERVEA